MSESSRALRAHRAAAMPPAGQARSLLRRGCGAGPRCRRDPTSLRRRRRRSPRGRHPDARPDRRAPAPATGCRPARILLLARTSRWLIAAGETRKAEAIVAASKPRMVCRISGARTPTSIAGWAQANISARRSSGMGGSLVRHRPPAPPSGAGDRRRPRWSAAGGRHRSSLRRAHRQQPGLRASGHDRAQASRTRAAAKASDSASSAPATSRVRAARKATSLP